MPQATRQQILKQQHQVDAERGIAGFVLKNQHLTLVIFLVIVIVGAISYSLLPKDLLPSSHQPAVQILAFYPGMPAAHVAEEITYPFERYTGQAVGLQSQESKSLMGVSIIRNYFNSTVDLSAAISQTGAMVMSAMRKMPPGTEPPLILPFDPMATVPLALCAVGGSGKTETEDQDVARYRVTNTIQGVAGAMAPAVMGGQTRQAVVYLDQKKLLKYNLSPNRVAEKLATMNTFIPAGDLAVGDFDYQIVSNGLFRNLPEVNAYYLRSMKGVSVEVNQVGETKDSSANQTNVVLVDGKKQVYIPIYRQPGANSIRVIDDVRQAIAKLEATLPGFKLTVISDQSVFVRQAIEAISHEALIGGGFAALMILLFLGNWSATFAVLLSLPVSILCAFVVLKAMGETLNVMTLGGLALSVGVLVDNAIVVIEVIMQKRAAGLSARDAALRGTNEVSLPVLASTVATLIVFVPVLFLEGSVKLLFSALAIAVVAALIASYFAAMMLIPLFAAHFLKIDKSKRKGSHSQVGVESGAVGRVTIWYTQLLKMAMRRAWAVIAVSAVLLLSAGFLLTPRLGFELFPRSDAGSFRLDLRAASGLRVEKTVELANQIDAKIHEWIAASDLKMTIVNAGVYYGYSAAFTPNSGQQDAFITVELTDVRKHSSQYYAKMIRERMQKEFSGIEVSFQLGGLLSSSLNSGLPAPIDIQVGGPSLERAHDLAQTLVEIVKKVQGAVDVRLRQRLDAPQMMLEIDRRKASDLGLTADLVVKNVVSAVSNSSSYSPAVWVDPKTGIDYSFGVQYRRDEIQNFDDVLKIPIVSPDQERSVPLRMVASTRIQHNGPTEINHKNLQPVVDIFVDSQGRDIGSVASDVKAILETVTNQWPKDYWYDVRGEITEMRRSLQSLTFGLVLAALFVYLVLVTQFRSFLYPAIIMTTVPMGLVGVVIVMTVWPTYFSIQSAIGCIFVVGVAVSHGVLLLESMLEFYHQSGSLHESIIRGAYTRFRPITMTSLASIFALIPMACGMGLGSEANVPLGRAVIGGQVLSTLLNFFVVPCLFYVLQSRRERRQAMHNSSAANSTATESQAA